MKVLITTFATLLIGWIIIGSPFIFGDGYGYYHAGKTLVTKTNFISEEKPEYFNYSGHGVIEYNNKFITPYPVGNAILWIPFLGISSILNSGNLTNDYYKAFNGHSLADGIAISLSGLFLATISIYIIYQSLLLLGFSKRLSYFSSLATFIASFGLAYTLINSAYSHIYEIFCFSIIIYFCVKIWKQSKEKMKVKRWQIYALGLACGLLVLIRPFDAILLLPVGVFLLKELKTRSLYALISAIPSGIIFIAYNYQSYGSLFTTGYSISESFAFNFNLDRLLQLLLSDIRGWYVYSPLMLASTLGLIALVKHKRDLILITFIPSILIILGYSFWQNWWAGDSAGQRFFLVLTPVMAIGTAQFISWLSQRGYKKIAMSSLILLTAYSLGIFTLYRFTPTSKIGENRTDYQYINSYERFGVSDIIKYHYSILTTSSSVSEYISNLQQGLTGGRSLAMIYLGFTKPIINIEESTNSIQLFIIPAPTMQNVNSNILIAFYDNQITKLYSISSLNTSVWSQIDIECYTRCSSSQIELKEISTADFREFNQQKEIQLNSGKITFYIDNQLKLEPPIQK